MRQERCGGPPTRSFPTHHYEIKVTTSVVARWEFLRPTTCTSYPTSLGIRTLWPRKTVEWVSEHAATSRTPIAISFGWRATSGRRSGSNGVLNITACHGYSGSLQESHTPSRSSRCRIWSSDAAGIPRVLRTRLCFVFPFCADGSRHNSKEPRIHPSLPRRLRGRTLTVRNRKRRFERIRLWLAISECLHNNPAP